MSPPIFSALCSTWRLASSLCSDDSDVVASASALCNSIRAAYTDDAQYKSCLQPYAGIRSTSKVLSDTLGACEGMNGEPMDGCDSCTSATACPNPLVSYADGCIDMDMGQCANWRTFCNSDASPTGAGAAVLCRRPGAARNSVVAPPRPPSPPPPSPRPPPVVVASTPPPASPSPAASPNPSPAVISSPGPIPTSPPSAAVIVPVASPPPSPAPAPSPSPPGTLQPEGGGGGGGGTPSSAASPPAATSLAVVCVADGTNPMCVSYVYPNTSVAADLTNLCAAMPYMPGCSIRDACRAGTVTGDFCRPMTLLASICLDMPSMGGCKSYRGLCRNGTVVQQCRDFPVIPGLPTTKEAQASVDAMCASMYMERCDTCNQVSCDNYIDAMSSMCTDMPYMEGCPTWADWCKTAAGWEAAAPGNSMAGFCAGAAAYGGSSGSGIPSMLMFFHQRTKELLLFREWMPTNEGQAVASFIAISAMGFVAVALRTANSILQTAAAAGRLGPRLAPGSVAGGPWWMPSGSQALLNFVSSIMSLLVTTLDLFTMLIAMTFNGAYFAAVVLGYMLGALFLGHLRDAYARHIGRPPSAADAGAAAELGQSCCAGAPGAPGLPVGLDSSDGSSAALSGRQVVAAAVASGKPGQPSQQQAQAVHAQQPGKEVALSGGVAYGRPVSESTATPALVGAHDGSVRGVGPEGAAAGTGGPLAPALSPPQLYSADGLQHHQQQHHHHHHLHYHHHKQQDALHHKLNAVDHAHCHQYASQNHDNGRSLGSSADSA
ncbi:hypothetical protein HYH02_006089 [Chlamydomonas schloesseri]|uniref:CTR type copper ion transporter n=1 Tax=Chlamydomonas schloesseri TaxID=2026947 RepID=A0A835WJS2_9CHLO|nr:hypothetical protein HYH02_006089 [Chlamydomonas schloesseri]|eukprot:KAG2448735.1 hypothetical protein HYH02_006089 [Chlamydomonas schloesseri]